MNTLITRTKEARARFLETESSEDKAILVALLDEVEDAGLVDELYR